MRSENLNTKGPALSLTAVCVEEIEESQDLVFIVTQTASIPD